MARLIKLKNPFKSKVVKAQEKEEEKRKNILSNRVKVIIKRKLGEHLYGIAGQFYCEEKKDDVSSSLVIYNEKRKFKESLDQTKQSFINNLSYKLNLKKLTTGGKIDAVLTKIDEQEERVKSISEGKINGEIVNEIDERNKLKHYKILLDYVKYSGNGSYEEINENGERQYTFLFDGGMYIPFFHGSTNVSMSPDHGSKRKIWRAEQDLIDQEKLRDLGSPWEQLFKKLGLIALTLLLIANVYWTNQVMTKSQEYDQFLDSSSYKDLVEKIETSNLKCAVYYSQSMEENVELLEWSRQYLKDALEYSNSEQAKETEDESPTEKFIGMKDSLIGGN